MAGSSEARQPESTLSTPRIVSNPWIILLVLVLGFFMILLDTTIVNVAIPSMINGLNATFDQVLWILNAYVLVYAVLLITAGRLGDMFGPKRLFIIGLIVFTLSSAACGLTQTSGQLIVFRVLQAVGGALLTPQSMSIIASIFRPEQRGAAFGVWAGAAGLAAAVGPTLGGVLTTAFSWRAIFYVNVPIGIVALILAFLLMPELTIHRKHHLDVTGILLASTGLFVGIFALIEGEKYQWGRIWDAGSFSFGLLQASILSIPTLLALSVVLIVLFVVWEARPKEEPLLPLSLFRDRNFSLSNLVSAIVAFGLFGFFLPFSIYLQSVLGMSALDAGVVLVPMSLISMVVAPVAGRLADRINAKWILAAGLTCFAIGMGLVIWLAGLHSQGTTFTIPLLIAGVGMGCTFAPLVTTAMRNIAPTQAGAASGFINTVRQVGGTFGSAVVGAVLQNQLANNMHVQALRYAVQVPGKFRAGFVQSLSHAASQGFHLGRGQAGGSAPIPGHISHSVAVHLQEIGRAAFQYAYLDSMKPALFLGIAVLLGGAVITLFFKPSESRLQLEKASTESQDQPQPRLVTAGE